VKLGIATGGWGHTARLKLASAGLPVNDIPMYSSDDADTRTQIMLQVKEKLGTDVKKFLYIGDAVWDLMAAEKLGWEFIGVGDRLKNKCKFLVPDLTSAQSVIDNVIFI